MLSALRAQTRNVDFVETGFTGRTDFIVVRYSVTTYRATISSACKVKQSRTIVYEVVRVSTGNYNTVQYYIFAPVFLFLLWRHMPLVSLSKMWQRKNSGIDAGTLLVHDRYVLDVYINNTKK
jgi:hypothetical protein